MPLGQLLNGSPGDLQAELQLVFDAVDEGLFGVDAQGNATFCNQALLRMTGYQAEELIGKSVHAVLHHSRPDGTKYPEEECPLRKALRSHKPFHARCEFYWRRDGVCVPADYRILPLPRRSGPTGCVVILQDISERERSREALRASEGRFRDVSNTVLQNEEKFRRILTSMADVAWTSDREHRTTYVSPKVESVLGYTKEEFCAGGGGSLRAGLIHPADFGRVNRGYRALFEKQSPFDEEYRIQRKDGSWIWIHDRATGTHEENGVLYADGFFSDVTRRKLAESQLQSKTAFLEAQVNSTIDAILVVDGNGQVLLHNQKFIEMFQVPPGLRVTRDDRRLLQHVLTLILDPESFLAKVKRLYHRSRETSRDEIVLKDGRVLDRYSAPVVDQEGKYYGRIWNFRDITERKRNEDTLRQLSTAVEQSPVSVVITNPQGDIGYVNRSFTDTTGYRPEEVLGKNPRFLNAGVSPPGLFKDLWFTILQGRQWQGEFCNKRKNGEIYWEAATIQPIIDAQGSITHYLALKEDITKRRRAEEALRASEKRYRLLFERNLAGVFRTTLDGRILECNPAAAHLFGCNSPEELMTHPITDFYYSTSDREALLTILTSEKSVTNHEIRFQRKNGESAWAMLNLGVVDHDSGTGRVMEGTFIDITERKRAEEELYGSRQMLQSILDAIPQRVFWKDRNGIYLGGNRALASDAGLDTPAAIVGKTDFDLAWRASAELYRSDDQQVMEQGLPKLNFEERQNRPDGSVLWLHTNKLPLRDRDGVVTGVLGTYEDITERKQSEEALRLAQSSLEHAADAIYWISPVGGIVYANQAACRHLDHSRDEFLALSVPDIDPLFPREVWSAFWEDLKTRGSRNFETQHKTKQGRIFPVEITATYLEFDGQEYALAFARDITERRQLESQLRQAHKLEGIGQLAAGIAHEINTPTQFVADNLTFLRDSWKTTRELLQQYRDAIQNASSTLPPDLLAALQEAERKSDFTFVSAEVPHAIDQSLDGTHRVAEIVRAMKEFSHPDSVEKTATDLNKGVASTITVARNEWKYVANIATRFDETLPSVVCYPGDVNQVVLNLLVNAAHAIKDKMKDGEKGKITVCTHLRGEFAEISVTDSGTGIPEEIRPRIFDPFFTTKEVGKGTGQGLSLAHGVIVKKHSGKIWFETEMGRGTTFFIHLPIQPPDRAKES